MQSRLIRQFQRAVAVAVLGILLVAVANGDDQPPVKEGSVNGTVVPPAPIASPPNTVSEPTVAPHRDTRRNVTTEEATPLPISPRPSVNGATPAVTPNRDMHSSSLLRTPATTDRLVAGDSRLRGSTTLRVIPEDPPIPPATSSRENTPGLRPRSPTATETASQSTLPPAGSSQQPPVTAKRPDSASDTPIVSPLPPTISAQEPSVAPERYMGAAAKPSIATSQPATTVERPVTSRPTTASTERPVASRPTAAPERPTMAPALPPAESIQPSLPLQQPNVAQERPGISSESPTASMDKPAIAPEKPMAGTERPATADPVVAKPNGSLDAPPVPLQTVTGPAEASTAGPALLPPSVPQPEPKPKSPSAAPVADSTKPQTPRPVAPAGDEIEPASFKGVIPGKTPVTLVQKTWGVPKEIRTEGDTTIQVFAVDPFDNVEVTMVKQHVASIVIRLNRPFPADAVTKQLDLAKVRPVLVSNEMGEILGQCFPERGVLFAFEPNPTPGKASMQVTQIILEPISAESFILRAETNLDTQIEASVRDLEQAIRLSPQNARAMWLKARALSMLGDFTQALAALDEAIRLDPKDPQFRVTRAQILGQLGRLPEAIREAEKAVSESEQRPHVKARAQCLLGDLFGSGGQPDFKKAIDQHVAAIKTADQLSSDPHPSVRLPAKETLIDAHLGAAHDIAWGNWNQKETSVPNWLKRASAFTDELIQNDGGTPEHRFRIATRALAAYVGAQGKLDPSEWVEQMLKVGQELALTGDSQQKKQVQWEMGLALYDAVQIYQFRNQRDLALKYGQQAAENLEQSGRARTQEATAAYLLGRLYFRLGSIHAIGEQNHKVAIVWFDKAVPALEKSASQVSAAEQGRLGETMVSMGISYWEAGRRETAMKLTQQGIGLIEQAVSAGAMPKTALDVPQANLVAMSRQVGLASPGKAPDRIEKAARTPDTLQR